MPLPLYTFEQFLQNRQSAGIDEYPREEEQVRKIIGEVRLRGDAAVKEYTRVFDGAGLDSLRVSGDELEEARRRLDPALLEVIRGARENIERFHQQQARLSWWEAAPGRMVGQRRLPLKAVGIYVPGGTAAYPSSVLMTVLPARIAGVREIYLCTPPDREGRVNSSILAAALEAGVTAVFKAGGAQAIAALAYGTETIPAVQKIVGPGNIYVTLAKREVFGKVGIDLLAGPSEILIVADKTANASYIAADLLSQAEHDPLARPLLVTTSPELARQVLAQVAEQLQDLPRREIAKQALQEQGAVVLAPSLEDAWTVANELAPEHLELHLADPWSCLARFENAGAIFVGAYSPEPLGDYWAGTNHVLPTGRAARYASPLGVDDFVKFSNVIYYSADALLEAALPIERLARAERLEGHARAVALRRRDLEQRSKD